MSITLESLARDSRDVLAADRTSAGRERVAALLSQALRDPAFLREVFAAPVGERKIVHQDAELGFCILAHEYDHGRQGRAHDHGHTWAIYGQAEGESVMEEFERVGDSLPARARKVRTETLRPGDARLYDLGAIHAQAHPGPARLVRIEGEDLSKVRRNTYEVVE